MLPHCLTLQEWLRQCDNSGLGLWHVQVPRVQVGCMGQLPSSAPSPCPTACMPYLEEGHVLAIVLFALLQICAVDEGAALLGIAITCGDTTESVRQPCPAHTWRTPTPQGHRCEGVMAAYGSCRRAAGAVGTMLVPSPSTGNGRPASQPPVSPPTPHTGRGCRPQEPRAALPGRADVRTRQSASTQ